MDEQQVTPIVYKVLSGEQYATTARFAGILHEAYVNRIGRLVPFGDVAMYGQGSIVNNSISGNIGLIVDPSNIHYAELPEPHLSRLVDVVDGDGWMDTVAET